MNMPIYIWYSGDLNIGGAIKWFLLSCIDKQFKIMEYYTVYWQFPGRLGNAMNHAFCIRFITSLNLHCIRLTIGSTAFQFSLDTVIPMSPSDSPFFFQSRAMKEDIPPVSPEYRQQLGKLPSLNHTDNCGVHQIYWKIEWPCSWARRTFCEWPVLIVVETCSTIPPFRHFLNMPIRGRTGPIINVRYFRTSMGIISEGTLHSWGGIPAKVTNLLIIACSRQTDVS